MTYKDTIQKWLSAQEKIKMFKNEHQDIFSMLDKLQSDLVDIDNSLKELARVKGDYKDEKININVSQPFKKWYDFDIIKNNANENELIILEQCIDKIVNKEKVEQLAKGNLIRKELLQMAFKEEAQTPRVTIKYNQNDN